MRKLIRTQFIAAGVALSTIMLFLGLFLYSFHVTENGIVTGAILIAERQPNLTATGVGQAIYSIVCGRPDESLECSVDVLDSRGITLFSAPAFSNRRRFMFHFSETYALNVFSEKMLLRFTRVPRLASLGWLAATCLTIASLPTTLFFLFVTALNRKKLAMELLNAQLKIELADSKLKMTEMASQAAHDIRSPLSALNLVVASLGGVEEEKRELIRNAARRINDIANGLLRKSSNYDQALNISTSLLPTKDLHSISYLPDLIESIISEKRATSTAEAPIYIELEICDRELLFASLNPSELSRAVSNILNNAAEALRGSIMKIQVKLSAEDGGRVACLEIADNGRGIPEHLLPRIGEGGFTYGKHASSESGSGIGFKSARDFFQSVGGSLGLKSELGVGTTVIAHMPLTSSPPWLVSEVNLEETDVLVSVDDDSSIHQVWAARLKAVCKVRTIKHLALNCPSDLEMFLSKTGGSVDRLTFAVDFDFSNSEINGIDLIKNCDLNSKSFLVSSRFDDLTIRRAAIDSQIRFLPKSLVAFVAIKV